MTPGGSTATLASFLHGMQGTSPRNNASVVVGNHAPVSRSPHSSVGPCQVSRLQVATSCEPSCALQHLVKEVWFCIPKDTDQKGLDDIEKIMDGELEGEMALEYQASPVLHDVKKIEYTSSFDATALRHAIRSSQRRKREVAPGACNRGSNLHDQAYPSRLRNLS